jgi:hypothetical protein
VNGHGDPDDEIDGIALDGQEQHYSAGRENRGLDREAVEQSRSTDERTQKVRGRGHRDNVGLRTSMQQQIPLIHLLGVVAGRYMASWPAYIVGDDYLPAPQARRLIG